MLLFRLPFLTLGSDLSATYSTLVERLCIPNEHVEPCALFAKYQSQGEAMIYEAHMGSSIGVLGH